MPVDSGPTYSVGDIACNALAYQPQINTPLVEQYARPGLSGVGLLIGGDHITEDRAESWTVYQTEEEAESHRASVAGIVGTIVEVRRGSLVTSNVAVLGASTDVRPGGGGRWIAKTSWRLLHGG